MASVEELQADIDELKKLLEQATRSKVKDLLNMNIWKLTAEVTQKQEDQVASMASKAEEKASADQQPDDKAAKMKSKLATKVLSTYAWDQSEKFMKIYVTLDGVQDVSKENIILHYEDGSFSLRVAECNNCNYTLNVGPLYEQIVPDKSYHKVKRDLILVMLKKAKEGKTWADVTRTETKDKKAPKMDETKDPNESMMDMMKQMYEDGDDDMKRTIAKAMYESQNRKGAPEGLDL